MQFLWIHEEAPDPWDLSCENKKIMIFDDLFSERRNECESYYIPGGHNDVDCFYLLKIISSHHVKPSEEKQILFAPEKSFGFVVIDLMSKKHNGKNMIRFDEF